MLKGKGKYGVSSGIFDIADLAAARNTLSTPIESFAEVSK